MPSSPHSHFLPYGTKILLISHSVFWLAANLILPFFSIFFIDELVGVTLTEIGIATLIFFLTFGLLEPVMGLVADKIDGFKDEIFFVIFGYVARGVLFMLLAFAQNVWHLYMFHFFLGVFRAIAGPSDKVLYAKYLSGRQSATLWGIDESMINISAALGSGIGGYFISLYGFRYMFIATGLMTIVSGLVNYPLLRALRKTRK
jgi:MFS family permease